MIPAVREWLNSVSNQVIGAALEVHRELGPGLLESAYEICLAVAIREAGLKVERQKPQAVAFRGKVLDCGYRLDLVVEDALVVEIKAIGEVLPVHCAQLLSYLRFSGYKVGLLFNFNVKWFARDGIKRIVNGLPE